MDIAFFGSSIVSSYWNGAATYYRGIARSMHERRHAITFYEPDAWERQQNRDMADPSWANVMVYSATRSSALRAVESARNADMIVKASGVGVFDDLLEEAVLNLKRASNLVIFWDVDAAATLERLRHNPADPFLPLIPQYDAIFTYGGGDPVIRAYEALGARRCVPIYNATDPGTHFPVPPNPQFSCDLAFLGNRLPDREARVEEFFLSPAGQLSEKSFLLGGAGWSDKPLKSNIRYLGHLSTRDHNVFNSSPLAVLNVTRDSMAQYGFSPATRVFEAASAAACLITDAWAGIEMFFEPGAEILVASSGEEVVEHLRQLTKSAAGEIGLAAYRRVIAEHTYAHRASQIDKLLDVCASERVPVAV
jgi:spore maturation protein CgeB